VVAEDDVGFADAEAEAFLYVHLLRRIGLGAGTGAVVGVVVDFEEKEEEEEARDLDLSEDGVADVDAGDGAVGNVGVEAAGDGAGSRSRLLGFGGAGGCKGTRRAAEFEAVLVVWERVAQGW